MRQGSRERERDNTAQHVYGMPAEPMSLASDCSRQGRNAMTKPSRAGRFSIRQERGCIRRDFSAANARFRGSLFDVPLQIGRGQQSHVERLPQDAVELPLMLPHPDDRAGLNRLLDLPVPDAETDFVVPRCGHPVRAMPLKLLRANGRRTCSRRPSTQLQCNLNSAPPVAPPIDRGREGACSVDRCRSLLVSGRGGI
jgi:hypothetical protein